MAEKGHQALQRAASVHQGRGIGVPELVRVGMRQARDGSRSGEFFLQALGRDAPAPTGEKELDEAEGAWVPQRAAWGPVGHDAVDDDERLVVEGDHALGAELPERHLEPGSLARDLVDAVELEVEQFSDAQPAGPLQQQGVSDDAVGPGLQHLGQAPVGVGRQVARQRPRGRGRSLAKMSRRVGASAQLHSARSSNMRRTARMRFFRSATTMGSPER